MQRSEEDRTTIMAVAKEEYPSVAAHAISTKCSRLKEAVSQGCDKESTLKLCAEVMDIVKSLAFSIAEPPELGEAHAKLDQEFGGYTCNLVELDA